MPGFYRDHENWTKYSRFERLGILSIESALVGVEVDPMSDRVLVLLSTTKGNIELLESSENSKEQLQLSYSANMIASYFGHPNKPIVISNACISGVLSLLVANRMLASGDYDHAIVLGVDVLSDFVLSGFQSLNAMSPLPCKPFDKDRKGISLGEASGTVIISREAPQNLPWPFVKIVGGGLSNDANHISGPSKTGKELALAIKSALQEANVEPSGIDLVSAHGTGTLFNDEMESKAFHIAQIADAPMNSLKGSIGHTLGAAGIVESIMTVHGLIHDEVLPTVGFEKLGVSQPLNISSSCRNGEYKVALKTASGFGGCNAAIVFQKQS
ncbi:MAG: beta-ketoacyl synthase N-terminal-like domain-containing protein [Cyclobacteriaceae bacterium]